MYDFLSTVVYLAIISFKLDLAWIRDWSICQRLLQRLPVIAALLAHPIILTFAVDVVVNGTYSLGSLDYGAAACL